MFVAVAFLLLFILPVAAPAAGPEEEYKRLQERLHEHSRKLSEAQRQESSILGELEDVNRKMGKMEADLRKHRKSLSQTEAEIAALNADMTATKLSIQKRKEWIKRKLRAMHRFGFSGDTVILLLSAADMSQMMRVWKYLESISVYEHGVLTTYNNNLRMLHEKDEKLKVLFAQLKTTAEKIKDKENELGRQRKSKETLLSSVRTEKASHQKMISELREASRRLLDIIRESSKTDTYAGTGFPRLKGRLLWPVDGRIAVPYGAQKDQQFETPVFRNGVHIQTSSNSDARSVYEGRVIFAEWFKGFGQLIIINHGDGYHTLYGNLSEIFSRVGDIIKENQVIGRVGTSGVLSGPGLYFEVRYKGKPLDPTQWLRHKRK